MQSLDNNLYCNNGNFNHHPVINNQAVFPTEQNIQDIQSQLNHWINAKQGEEAQREQLAKSILNTYINGEDILAIMNFDNVSSLPDAMGKLQQLKSLHIINCSKLTEIPYCVGERLLGLKEFCIVDTPIKTLPHNMGSLELEKMIMHNTHLEKIPNCLQGLTTLKALTVSAASGNEDNVILEVPNWLFNKPSLEELVLDHACVLDDDNMQQICQLTNLKNLSLDNCDIIEIPDQITNLVGLEKLNISHCQLTFISPELGNLVNLRELMLSGTGTEADAIQEYLEDTYDPQDYPNGLSDVEKNQVRAHFNYENIIPNSVANLESLQLLDVSGAAFSIPCINKFLVQGNNHGAIVVVQHGVEVALLEQQNAIETAIATHHNFCVNPNEEIDEENVLAVANNNGDVLAAENDSNDEQESIDEEFN